MSGEESEGANGPSDSLDARKAELERELASPDISGRRVKQILEELNSITMHSTGYGSEIIDPAHQRMHEILAEMERLDPTDDHERLKELAGELNSLIADERRG